MWVIYLANQQKTIEPTDMMQYDEMKKSVEQDLKKMNDNKRKGKPKAKN